MCISLSWINSRWHVKRFLHSKRTRLLHAFACDLWVMTLAVVMQSIWCDCKKENPTFTLGRITIITMLQVIMQSETIFQQEIEEKSLFVREITLFFTMPKRKSNIFAWNLRLKISIIYWIRKMIFSKWGKKCQQHSKGEDTEIIRYSLACTSIWLYAKAWKIYFNICNGNEGKVKSQTPISKCYHPMAQNANFVT